MARMMYRGRAVPISLLLSLSLILVSTNLLHGQVPPDRTERLASLQIDVSAGHFAAKLPANERLTRSIRLEMKEGSLRISRLIILFQDGQAYVEEKPIILGRGERTKPIGRPEKTGVVQQIEFEFDRQSSGNVILDIDGILAAPATVATPPSQIVTSTVPTTSSQATGQTPAERSAPLAVADVSSVKINVNYADAALIRRVRVSRDGKLLALGDDTGTVRILDFQRFEVLRTIKAHEGRVRDMDFSSDGRMLVTGGDDRAIRFWEPSTGSQARPEITLSDARPFSVRLNTENNNRYLIVGDGAGRFRAWNLERNTIISDAPNMHSRIVYSVGYKPGGKGTFFTAGADGLVKVRNPNGHRWKFDARHGAIRVAGYTTTGEFIYTAGVDRRLRLWDSTVESGKLIAEFEGNLKYILTADVSHDGRFIASGGGDKAINIYDIAGKKLAARLTGHANDIEALTFTPDSRFIVSSSEDRSLRIWSVEGRELVFSMFFDAKRSSYVGLTSEQQYFGDQHAPLLSVYKDGKLLKGAQLREGLEYLGVAVNIIPNG
jgi:WD domain, G-beta repeat